MLAMIGDLRVHYELAGPDTGDVVCLVHGLLMDTGIWADQLEPLLAMGFRVLRMDLRGHGGSDAGEGRFGPEDLAHDVLALLDRLGVDSVHYVGVSLGGVVGQALALSAPERLKSLILCSTPTATFPDVAQAWRSRAVGALKDRSTAKAAGESLSRWFPPSFRTRRPSAYQSVFDTACATRPEGYAGCLEALQGYDYNDRLAHIVSPTLVVCGAVDGSTTAIHHETVSGRIRGAAYHSILEAAHLPNVERHEAFNQILTDWLAIPHERTRR